MGQITDCAPSCSVSVSWPLCQEQHCPGILRDSLLVSLGPIGRFLFPKRMCQCNIGNRHLSIPKYLKCLHGPQALCDMRMIPLNWVRQTVGCTSDRPFQILRLLPFLNHQVIRLILVQRELRRSTPGACRFTHKPGGGSLIACRSQENIHGIPMPDSTPLHYSPLRL